jgi:hypothetical protein
MACVAMAGGIDVSDEAKAKMQSEAEDDMEADVERHTSELGWPIWMPTPNP